MRSVYVNLGPLVSFRNAPEHSLENSIESPGLGIVVEKGAIAQIKDSEELIEEFSIPDGRHSVVGETACFDLEGHAVVPGLLDGHTHLLWAGDRSREVSWRREGKSYAEIASMGGEYNTLFNGPGRPVMTPYMSSATSGYVRLYAQERRTLKQRVAMV